jgi:hypothetical protein
MTANLLDYMTAFFIEGDNSSSLTAAAAIPLTKKAGRTHANRFMCTS